MKKIYAINDNGTLLFEAGKFDTAKAAQDYIDSMDEEDDHYLMKVVNFDSEKQFDFVNCIEYSDYSEDEQSELLRVLVSDENPHDYTSEEKEFIFTQFFNSGAVEFLQAEYERHFYTAVVVGGYATEEDFYEVNLEEYKSWAIKRLNCAIDEINKL